MVKDYLRNSWVSLDSRVLIFISTFKLHHVLATLSCQQTHAVKVTKLMRSGQNDNESEWYTDHKVSFQVLYEQLFKLV